MDQQFCQSVAAVTELRTTNSSSLSNSPTSSSSSQEASSSDVEQQELDKQRSTLKYQIMKASELASSGNISVFYKQGGLQPEFVPILPKSTTSNSSVEDQSPHQKVPQQNVDKVVATTPITFANRPGASHVTNNQLVTSSSSATAGKHQTDITEEASLQAKLEQKKALTVTPVKKHIPSNQQQKSVRSPVQAKLHQPTNHKQQIQPQVKPSVQQQVKPPTGQQQAKPSNVQQQVKPNTVQQVKSPAAQSKPNITPIQGIKTVVQSPKPQLTPVQGKKLLTVQIKQNQTAVQTKQAQQIQGKPIQPIKIKSAPVLVKTSLPNKHQGQNQFQVQSVVSVSKPSQISATKHPILQSNIQLKSLQQSPTPLLPKSIQLSSATSASIGGLQQTKTLQTAATTFTVTSKRPNTTLANSATPSKRPALLLDERNHLMPPASQAERSRKSYQSTKRKSKVVPLSDSDINKIGQFKLPSQVSAQPVQQTKQLNQQQNAAFQLKQQQQQSHLVSTIPLPPVTATVLPAGLSQAITLITHHNILANVSTPNITETPQSTASVDKSFVLNQPPPTNETNGTFRILLVTDRETYTFNVDGSGEQLAENLQKVQGGCNKDVERVITESFKRQAMEAVKKQQQDTSNLVDSRISQDLQQLQSQIMEKDDETSPQPPHSPSPSKAETNYNEGRMALCHQCGFSSPSYDQCTRCKTKLPPDVKSIRMSPVTVPMSDSQSITVKRTNEVAVAVADSPKKRQKTTKRKKVEEPVCLTISSDDEDANDSRCNNFKLSDSGGAMDEAANSVVHQDPAITQSAMQKEPVITDEDEESIKDGEYQDPMETEMCDQIGAMKDDFDNLMNNSNEDSEWPIVLNCRTVRIGSYKVIPDDSVYITILGLFITMPSVAYESVRIEIPWFSVVKILAHFGKGMPVLFIYTTSAMGARIRKMLGMTDKNNSPYYDPASANESQRRITLLPENISVDCSGILKKLFSHLERTEYEELSQSEANDILVRASPKEVQNQIIKTVVKPQQTVMLPTDIQTIMVYPPPPAKGGIPINTEDYACLGEDQFLNDVIIDFYLKYIHQHFLSEKDQARTHILSTFFYKRLTTKPTSSRKSHNPVENDPKATAAEKRHSRVKSWTKSVDIFKKDFIIIPINEHSHWFLAVICFPGLTGPVDFETNQPMAVNDSKAKTKQQSTENNIDSKSVMAGKTSMTIGSTTITPVNTSPSQQQPSADTVTLLQPEEEDRDEADGEDEDFEQQTSSEEDQEAETDENKEPEQHVEEPIKENPEPVAEEKSKRSRKKEPRVPIKQPCILIFDSLATASRAKVVATLRDYLKVEYRVKHGVERQFTKEFMKGASPKVPQQTNYTDCGLYVLQYVEAFFQAPITDYHIPMKMLQEWFDVDLVSRKRYDIQQLLHKLMAEQGIDYSTLNLPELNLAPFHHGLVDYPSSDEMMGEEEDDEYQAYGDAYQAMCNDARFNGYREEEVVEDEEEDEEEVVDEEEEEEEEEDEDEEVDDDRMECDGDEVEEDLEDEEELDEECVGVRRNHSQCDDLDKELMDEVVPNVVGLKAFRIPRLKLLRQQQQQQQLLRDEQQLNQISFINCDSQPTCDDNE